MACTQNQRGWEIPSNLVPKPGDQDAPTLRCIPLRWLVVASTPGGGMGLGVGVAAESRGVSSGHQRKEVQEYGPRVPTSSRTFPNQKTEK